MSRVVSIRLRDEQVERLERLARRLGRSHGETGALLIEEALRMADYAFIDFRDSIVGRQAYLQGSSLAVWEVVALVRAYQEDVAKVAARLQMPTHHVQAAVNYAAAFPAEIDAAIDDNMAYDAARVSRMLPQTRVFSMVNGALTEEKQPHAAPAS